MQVDLLRAESKSDTAIAGSDLLQPEHPPVEKDARLYVRHGEHKMIEAIGDRLSQLTYSAATGTCLRPFEGSRMAAAHPTVPIAANTVNS